MMAQQPLLATTTRRMLKTVNTTTATQTLTTAMTLTTVNITTLAPMLTTINSITTTVKMGMDMAPTPDLTPVPPMRPDTRMALKTTTPHLVSNDNADDGDFDNNYAGTCNRDY